MLYTEKAWYTRVVKEQRFPQKKTIKGFLERQLSKQKNFK